MAEKSPGKRVKEPVKGTYQHYKGGFYEVLGVAGEPSTGARFVVYLSLGISENLLGEREDEFAYEYRVVRNGSKGELAVCSIERFTELVDGGAYWAGKQVPRFRLISRLPNG